MLGSSTPYIAFPRKEATIPSLLSFYRHFSKFYHTYSLSFPGGVRTFERGI